MNTDLMRAILAMDSYNHGYDESVNSLGGVGERIGNAKIVMQSNADLTSDERKAGFYAIAYDTNGDGKADAISYRGTDDLSTDAGNGWLLGAGNVKAAQGDLAIKFYKDVVKQATGSDSTQNLINANITLTGHSLGGGLSGYIASLYHKEATAFDSMGYTMATGNAYWYATQPNTSQYYQDYTKPLLDLIYNGGPAWQLNDSKVRAFHLPGEVLDNRFIKQMDSTTIDVGSSVEDLLGPVEKHSMSTLVMGIFAKTSNLSEDWKYTGQYLWSTLYDNDFAYKIVQGHSNTSGADFKAKKYADVLRAVIAYSALEGTSGLLYGNTAIRAMFDDANNLGKILKSAANTHIVAHAEEISEIFVQYAGLLAINKKEGIGSVLTAGVLKGSADGKNLIVNLEDAVWKAASGETPNIISKLELVSSLLGLEKGIASPLIRDGMSSLWSDSIGNNINRIIFSNKDSTTTTVESSTTSKVTMYVASEGKDNITGSTGDDLILGGKGDDTLNGGAGKDILDGGLGNDTASYNLDTKGIKVTVTGIASGVSADVIDGSGMLDKLFSIEKIIGTKYDDTFISKGLAITLEGGNGGDIYDLRDAGGGFGTSTTFIEKSDGTGSDALYIRAGLTPTTHERELLADGSTRLTPQKGYTGPTVTVPPYIEDVIDSANGKRTPLSLFPPKEPDNPEQPENKIMDWAPNAFSPLVLDIDGDGVEVTKLGATGAERSNVHFDMNNDGFAERTAWVTGGDALLAVDWNRNGKIDNKSELFGDNNRYADGFKNLADLDTNHDGNITSADQDFSRLVAWIDSNMNGVSEASEMKSMASLKISKIDLNATALYEELRNDNVVTDSSTFVINGIERAVEDIWFRTDASDTVYLGDKSISAAAKTLPMLNGSGTLKDFSVAMTQDASLLKLVQDFVKGWSITKLRNMPALDAEIQTIFFKWAGVENIVSTSRGPNVNAKELAFIESVVGKKLGVDLGGYTESPGANPGAWTKAAYLIAFERLKADLLLQISGNDLMAGVKIYSIDKGKVEGGEITAAVANGLAAQAAMASNKTDYWNSIAKILMQTNASEDLSVQEREALDSAVKSSMGTNYSWQKFMAYALNWQSMGLPGSEGDDYMQGKHGNDTLSGNGGNDLIKGGAGDDALYGGNGDDTVMGGNGTDTIDGDAGNDRIFGDAGEDILSGGEGSDTYYYTGGDGVDTITETSGSADQVSIRGLYKNADITLGLEGSDDLVIFLKGQKSMILKDHFLLNGVEKIVLDDKSIIDLSNFKALQGTAGNDVLSGKDYALLKDDLIFGNDGNDTLSGGAGNDILRGGKDNDTYVYNPGNGSDVIRDDSGAEDAIKLGAGYTATNISFERVGKFDLAINSAGKRLILIENQFTEDGSIEKINFSNGTSIDLLKKVHTLQGTDGADTLYGISYGGGGDKIVGGMGNDIVYTGAGNDTVVYNSGLDTYYNDGGADIIQIPNAEIKVSDIRLVRSGLYDLNVYIKDTHSFILKNQFLENKGFQKISFADGTSLNLLSQKYEATGTDLNNYLYGISYGGNPHDILKGLGGNDTLYGYEGNDTLDGGKGTDYVFGGNGNDLYLVGYNEGLDRIYDDFGIDKISFSDGYSRADMTTSRVGNDLNIYLKGILSVIVVNHYGSTTGTVESALFANGDTVNLVSLLQSPIGTNNNDVLNGNSISDHIKGLGGDDTIHGYYGNDILEGGVGNDKLFGDADSDTYFFSSGFGKDEITDSKGVDDIIKFGGNITLSNLSFEREGYDLIIHSGANDSIKLNSHFIDMYEGTNYDEVERIVFSDGSQFDLKGNFSFKAPAGKMDVFGTKNADVIEGNSGANRLFGEEGDDTYIFNKGHGIDTIYDTAGQNDIIKFGAGLTLSNIRFESQSDDLVIHTGTADKIIIPSHFGVTAYNTPLLDSIEKIMFADGSLFDLKGMIKFSGTASGEYIYGTNYADTLLGMAGNDYLMAGEGDDVLNGGTGIDSLYGNNGNDTYIFAVGDSSVLRPDTVDETTSLGDDTIRLIGVNQADVKMGYAGDTLTVTYSKTDKIYIPLVYNYTSYSLETPVEKIVFDSGTVWDIAKNISLTGTVASENITGGGLSDILNGGAGNDVLEGGEASDTYVYSSLTGQGVDTVYDTSGSSDVIAFGAGIRPSDITLSRSGDYDLSINSAGKRLILVKDQFSDANIEFIKFSDGSSINLLEYKYTQSGTSGDDYITGVRYGAGGNIINAQAGSDSVFGGQGKDTINGGAGNDYIYGEGDSDILNGGSGDDTIYSGAGDDIIIYESGLDTFYDDGGSDTINVSSGIYTAKDASLVHSQWNAYGLDVYLKGSLAFKMPSQFLMNRGFEKITFADGSFIDLAAISYPVQGTSANETIHGIGYGGNANDILNGNAGDDTIYGYEGNDSLNGGIGNDSLNGGKGDDTYIINKNSGVDTIYETEGVDRVSFGEALLSQYIKLVRDAQDYSRLKVFFGGVHVLSVEGQFSSDGVEKFIFADGSSMNLSEVVFTTEGTKGNDTILGVEVGGSSNDILRGYEGNDSLYGNLGNDILDGGKGNDILDGGEGDDNYILATGYGVEKIYDQAGIDTISFGAGILKNQIGLVRDGNNMNILVSGNKVATIETHFVRSRDSIEFINFSDGTSIDLKNTTFSFVGGVGNDYLNGHDNQDYIQGLAGNDTINAYGGNDIIDGGLGNDNLYAGTGNDTYIFNKGSGRDNISDEGGYNDTIQFGIGITPENITFSNLGRDTQITVTNNIDTINISSQRVEGTNTIESLKFYDGFAVDMLNYENWIKGTNGTNIITGTNFSDTILGYSGNDTIRGVSGNDSIHGGSGNDTLYGGDGNDYVYGGLDNDTLYGDAGGDILFGDVGVDQMTGGAGADRFVFMKESAFSGIDTLQDFKASEGDRIDISGLLQGYDPLTKAITDFVQITTSGANSILKVDADGGANNFVQIATINGITGLTDEQALLNSGHLVAV